MAARAPRRDRRWSAIAAAVACIAIAGTAIHWSTRGGPPAAAESVQADHASAMRRAQFETGFRQAVVMLHAKEYEHAVTALHGLLKIAPEVPEVHVNMGFALVGLKRFEAARDFFVGATELAPLQANAYYGLAIALEGLGDLSAALGAMRTYVHLTTPEDPWLPKARAALWEWQERSAR